MSEETTVAAPDAADAPAPTFREALATDYVTDAVLKSAKNETWESVRRG